MPPNRGGRVHPRTLGRFRSGLTRVANAARGLGRSSDFRSALLTIYKLFIFALIVSALWPIVGLGVALIFWAASSPPVLAFDTATLTALLSFTGGSAALGGLTFSYSRAALDERSRAAGLEAGRYFLAATVMLAVALAGHFLVIQLAEGAADGASDPVARGWIMVAASQVAPTAGLVAATVGVFRLYVHLLERVIDWFPVLGPAKDDPG